MKNNKQCYETVHELRWADDIQCVDYKSKNVNLNDRKGRGAACQKYVCKDCGKRFDDFTIKQFADQQYNACIT